MAHKQRCSIARVLDVSFMPSLLLFCFELGIWTGQRPEAHAQHCSLGRVARSNIPCQCSSWVQICARTWGAPMCTQAQAGEWPGHWTYAMAAAGSVQGVRGLLLARPRAQPLDVGTMWRSPQAASCCLQCRAGTQLLMKGWDQLSDRGWSESPLLPAG